MEKIIYVATIFVMFLNITSCKKDSTQNNLSVSNETITNAAKVAAPILSVSLSTNRTLNKGQSFVHALKVMNGNMPVANAVIGVEDPISGQCSQVKTGSNGTVNYSSYVPTYLSGGFYQIRFYLPNDPTNGLTSTVSVYGAFTAKLLKYSKISLNTQSQGLITTEQMCYAKRVNNFSTLTGGTINTTLLLGIGKDIVEETMSNPVNNAAITVAAISCPTSLAVPPVGALYCAESAEFVASAVAKSTVKVLLKRMIAKSNLSNAEKANCNYAIDFTVSAGFGIAKFKIGQGLSTANLTNGLATGFDFSGVGLNVDKDASGNVKSVTTVGTILSGISSSELCVLSFSKK